MNELKTMKDNYYFSLHYFVCFFVNKIVAQFEVHTSGMITADIMAEVNKETENVARIISIKK